MSAIEAFHTAARRYVIERHPVVTRMATGRPREDQHLIVPRRCVLDAILAEVERFVPGDFGSLDEARELLTAAGATADDPFTRKPENAIEKAAIADERAAYLTFIRALRDGDELAQVEPLPFRRTLSAAEARQHAADISARWGWWYGGRSDRAELPPHLLLQSSLIDPRRPDIRDILARRGVRRVFELPEFQDDPAREIDLELAEFRRSEGYWYTSGAPWLIQVSHEDSTTFGGEWLIAEIKRRWPDWRALIYRGHDGSDEPWLTGYED